MSGLFKKYSFVILVILLTACNTARQQSITGCYKSKKYTLAGRGFLFIQGQYYTTGSTIVLRKDSSFEYTTCGNFLKGSWIVKNDSLCLDVFSNVLRSDTLKL